MSVYEVQIYEFICFVRREKMHSLNFFSRYKIPQQAIRIWN